MAVALTREGGEAGQAAHDRPRTSRTSSCGWGCKGGGCSGMSYSLEFDTELGPHDKKFEIDGVKVVVRRQELPLPERHDAGLRHRRG